MMIFKKSIPRRTFLRGAGVTLGLPLLDAMFPVFAAANTTAKSPLRVSYFYGPNGRIMNRWTPKVAGAGFELTPTLKPLAAFRDRMLVLSGLNIKAADARPGEGGAGHGRACGAFLTGIHPKPGGALGISVDQVLAKEFGKHTQLASLELAMDPNDTVGGNDGSYRAAYTKTISWRSGATPLPTEYNPRKVFERLIGESGSTDPAVRLDHIQTRRSILDFVIQDVARVSREIGPGDRAKFTEYLDAVRDIERRIQLAEEQSARELPEMDRPAGVPATYSEHAKLMFDLNMLAFQGDMTRVTTFMYGREGGDRPYREIGIGDGHHSLSHHAGNPEAIALCAQIDAFHSTLFAYFLERLQATPDGEGSLFDHSIIVYSSGLNDGNAHTHYGVPTLLTGGAMGKIQGGRHLQYPGLPLSNLHLTVLDMAGIAAEEYVNNEDSDATEKLDVISI
jgi:hypothetical protein